MNSPVQIQLTATDSDSGVKLVYYKLNDEAAVAGDVINIDNEGITTVQYWAVDDAGNQAETAVTVNLDKTAPVINNLYPANGSVINQAQPVITAQISDNLSGIDAGTLKLLIR